MQTKTCPYCGHTWVPRIDNPVRCPCCIRSIAIRKETGAAPSTAHTPVTAPIKEGMDNVTCRT